MFHEFIKWLDEYLGDHEPSAVLKAAVSLVAFASLMGAFFGSQTIRAGAFVAVILSLMSGVLLLIADRHGIRQERDTYLQRLNWYYDALGKLSPEPLVTVDNWEQTVEIPAVGDGVLVFTRWEQQRLTFRMVDALRAQVRTGEGRDPEASAGLMDSQSVKGADTVGVDTRGYDASKKINGRKRFIVTDTLGLLLVVLVLPASVQDRDGARKLLLELRHRQIMARVRRVRHLFADGGFAGALVDWARVLVKTTIEIVRKPQGQKGFAVIPRRWAVERTFAWITGYRRLARDYERHPATAEAIIRWAAINTMTRRIARGTPATRPGPRQYTTV
jgi:transposase